jgi:hypothetical protein
MGKKGLYFFGGKYGGKILKPFLKDCMREKLLHVFSLI